MSSVQHSSKIQDFMDGAIAKGTATGIAFAFGTIDDPTRIPVSASPISNDIAYTFFAGHDLRSNAIAHGHFFDLASLTKIIATPLWVEHALEMDSQGYTSKPFPFWPETTIGEVLQHRAGLPAWFPFYNVIESEGYALSPKKSTRRLYEVLASIQPSKPPHETHYSDCGFLALRWWLESKLEMPLETLFIELRDQYVPSSKLHFRTSSQTKSVPLRSHVLPSAHCSIRNRLVHGEVHDMNAYAIDGVSTHAGLFGTLDCVTQWAKTFVTNHTLNLRDRVSRSCDGVDSNKPRSRPFYFDRASPAGTTGGVLSRETFGHLGFTGTSLWVDPCFHGRCAYFVLLSNVLLPNENSKNETLEFRQTLHRLASDALLKAFKHTKR